MPQFDYNPAGPKTQVLGDTNTGKITEFKKVKGKRKPQAQDPYKAPTGAQSTGSTAAAPGKTAAEKAAARKAAAKKAAEKRKAEAAAAAAAARNPLNQPFKTPNEIRAEAARLAALGSPTEEALRTESAAQQRDISGLSTALTGRLAGLGSEYAATLGGLTSQYGQLAGQAQSAGESAAAAAGAPTSIAPGASPTVATTMAALGAVPATYAPAAAMRGAMLGGEARAALTKALADRATKVSGDTAKYLYQLQQDEYQKALAKETAAQNAQRLGLSQQTAEFGQQVDLAQLDQGQQRINIQAQKAAASIVAAATKGAKSKQDKIQKAKAAILKDPTKFIEISNPNAKIWDVVYMLEGVPYTISGVEAANEYEARTKAVSKLPAAQQELFTTNTASWLPSPPAKEATRQRTNEEIIRFLVPQLVNAGMKRANAIAWVKKNILTSTSTPTSSGVSGSTMYPTT